MSLSEADSRHSRIFRPPEDDADTWTHRVESTFPGWLDELMQAIDPLFPPSADFVPLAATARPPARVRLEKVASTSQQRDGSVNGTSAPLPKNGALLWTDDARWARLVQNDRVTAPEWYQDVREIELEIEGVDADERNRL